ncbi:MAG: GspH/FimT family pseudopilin [Xanthomonadales bacterium]|nr:GspH/FimT family pseudopilin [Xanthomonadales bacterium]
MNTRHRRGVTAFELMVAMAIVAILLSTGVPAVKNYTWNLRLRTAMDTLQTDLNLARAQAISHNTAMVICPAENVDDCAGTSRWQGGWMVFRDLNGDHHRQSGEALVKHAGASEFVDIRSSRSRSYLRFHPNGSAPGSNISIVFCDGRGARYAGKILVSNSGRIRSETGGIEATLNCP